MRILHSGEGTTMGQVQDGELKALILVPSLICESYYAAPGMTASCQEGESWVHYVRTAPSCNIQMSTRP